MRLSSKHAAMLAGASASLVGADATMADAQTVEPSETASKASRYADGVYNATGQYGGLPSSLTVRVRLVRDMIAGVEVGTPAKNPTSLGYQKRFAAAVPAVVVGRPIDQVKVGKLAARAEVLTDSMQRSPRSERRQHADPSFFTDAARPV